MFMQVYLFRKFCKKAMRLQGEEKKEDEYQGFLALIIQRILQLKLFVVYVLVSFCNDGS
jgi:hypothetical protein